jgi:hypothetical protein
MSCSRVIAVLATLGLACAGAEADEYVVSLDEIPALGTGELVCRAAGYAPRADSFRWMGHPDLQAVPMPSQAPRTSCQWRVSTTPILPGTFDINRTTRLQGQMQG